MSNTVSGGSPEGPIFVSAKVAAQRLGLTIWDVYELVKNGELAHRPRKGKKGEPIHIYAADLSRWARDEIAKESA